MPDQGHMAAGLIACASRRLDLVGIPSAPREARLLLAHALGRQARVMAPHAGDWVVSPDARARFTDYVERRALREPLAYITGERGFWTLDLAVSEATLIPRADSEALVESALRQWPERTRPLRMLDLGCGTGCLLLACLSEYPAAWGLGIDVSATACRLAASNARRAGLVSRSAFLCGDWGEAVGSAQANAGFDLVLSNPPYIRSESIAGLMPEVANFEPRTALDGGADGLAAYRIILPGLARLLKPGGLAILEVGAGQSGPVRAIAEACGLAFIALQPDLGGLDRAVTLRYA
ncbi:peptide chain release factor N(5)-glutamine methyltransferase [Lichenicoccus sp.]|uniref:peptide chain release factor N(5)-glutamine methyltransferase n=1 Tax=Lichenicoccus sp. TaxID=2781899 RepID=UPI003D151972